MCKPMKYAGRTGANIALRRLLLLLLAAWVYTGLCMAATRNFYHLSSSEGLSDILVNTIYKDSKGYVWLGTGVALDRFDGNNIKSYRFPGAKSDPERVNAITEGKDGEIFVGNHQGLFVLRPGSRELSPLCPSQINFPVNALVYRGDEKAVYIGSRYGLFVYRTACDSIAQLLLRDDVLSKDNEVTALWSDGDGGMWIAASRTLYYMDFATRRTEAYRVPVRSSVSRLTGRDGMLFVGTAGDGVIFFDTKRREFTDSIDIGNDIITSLSVDDDGCLYIATDGEGIFMYSIPGRNVVCNLSSRSAAGSRLRSNSIYSMLIDDRGLLWVGYYQDGVDYTPYFDSIFETYSYPGVIDTGTMAVRAVSIDGPRKLIGTREGLYYIDESTGRSAKFSFPDIRSNIIFSIAPYRGKYYIGTYGGGMYVFDPATLKLTDFDNTRQPFYGESIFSIVVDKDDNMWVGTSRGLFRFKDGQETACYNEANSQLPAGNVYEIFFDSSGRGWMCAENGMAVWNGETLSADRFPKGFVNNTKIRDVYEDSEHNLYFVPDRGQVIKSNLSLTHFEPIPFSSDVANSIITFVFEDAEGWLWFGTEKGLVRYDKKSDFRMFNNADGLLHPVFTLCPPQCDVDGNLWFGNTLGLIKLDFDRLKSQPSIDTPVFITDVSANGESVTELIDREDGMAVLRLPQDKNNLSINYSNPRYVAPEYQYIEYRLDGYDSEWKKKIGKASLLYYDLKPGTYTLRVRRGDGTPGETALKIMVESHFSWAVISMSVLLILAVALLVVFLVRHRRHREELRVHFEFAERTAQQAAAAAEDERRNRYKSMRMTNDECRRLLKHLDKIMKSKKPYTDPGLKIGDLAQLADVSGHELSFLFNQYLKKSYYDYVNEYRVAEFKHIVDNSDPSRYTLTALSQLCGFSSRATFFRHFKNVTVVTPAEYLRGKGRDKIPV